MKIHPETASEATSRKICSFEIETLSKAQPRDIDYTTTALDWDSDSCATTPINRWNLLRRRCHSDQERYRKRRRQFEIDLAEARLEDKQDLEILDFIRLGSCDKFGHNTLVFIAKHIPNDVIQQERTQRFIMQKLESVGQKMYSILYIHTGSNLWNSQVGLRITWNLFNRIPWEYRQRLDRIYVLHPDMYLHVAMWFFVRWFTPSMWEKVKYLSRVDDVRRFIPSVAQQLPSFVTEHDCELDMHPLMDYGFCTVSEVDSSSARSMGPVFYT